MKLEERTEVKMWLVDKISLKNSKLKKNNPVIPVLSICSKYSDFYYRDTCLAMFIAGLLKSRK